MKLFIECQYLENYGTASNPHWKYKGGEEYFYSLEDFRFGGDLADKKLSMIVDSLRSKVEWNDEFSQQYILGWSVVEDDYLTSFEKDQLEYEGKITYPTKYLNEETV
jgi:hypothetical protein